MLMWLTVKHAKMINQELHADGCGKMYAFGGNIKWLHFYFGLLMAKWVWLSEVIAPPYCCSSFQGLHTFTNELVIIVNLFLF